MPDIPCLWDNLWILFRSLGSAAASGRLETFGVGRLWESVEFEAELAAGRTPATRLQLGAAG